MEDARFAGGDSGDFAERRGERSGGGGGLVLIEVVEAQEADAQAGVVDDGEDGNLGAAILHAAQGFVDA